jgi:hypothetical protein
MQSTSCAESKPAGLDLRSVYREGNTLRGGGTGTVDKPATWNPITNPSRLPIVCAPTVSASPRRTQDKGAQSGHEEIMRDDNIEIIPACPPVGGTYRTHARNVENTSTNIRERSGEKVVIPAWPPKPVEVAVPPPVQRRHFVDPNVRGGRSVRKD